MWAELKTVGERPSAKEAGLEKQADETAENLTGAMADEVDAEDGSW